MGTIKIETSIDAFGMRFPFYMYQIFNCGRWCVYLFCGFHCFRII